MAPKVSIDVLTAIKRALRDKYAWPGGYPLAILMSDGECLCIDCAKTEYRQLAYSEIHKLRDGWRPESPFINWEDTELFCAHCNKPIESAYGDNETEEK